MTTANDLPNPSARFRPRADLQALHAFASAATAALVEKTNAECQASGVAEEITAWLADRHPVEEMAVLTRWGYAKEVDVITVWAMGEMFGIKLTRPLTLPESCRSVTACGRRFSEEDGYGLNPEYLAELTAAGGLEAYLEDHRRRESGWLPKSVDPIFVRLIDVRKALEVSRTSLVNFATSKDEGGRYPTWGEIEERFQILGDHMAFLRAGDTMRAAA